MFLVTLEKKIENRFVLMIEQPNKRESKQEGVFLSFSVHRGSQSNERKQNEFTLRIKIVYILVFILPHDSRLIHESSLPGFNGWGHFYWSALVQKICPSTNHLSLGKSVSLCNNKFMLAENYYFVKFHSAFKFLVS